MRNLSKQWCLESIPHSKELIMEIMDIHSVCWIVLAAIIFIIALTEDAELRAEMKNIRTASTFIAMVIALYSAIMWIAKEWSMWCM